VKSLSSEETILKAQYRLLKCKNIIIFNKVELPNEVNNYALVNENELLADLNLNIIIIHAKRLEQLIQLLILFENETNLLDILK